MRPEQIGAMGDRGHQGSLLLQEQPFVEATSLASIRMRYAQSLLLQEQPFVEAAAPRLTRSRSLRSLLLQEQPFVEAELLPSFLGFVWTVAAPSGAALR
mgnify:CR=1 FL=1